MDEPKAPLDKPEFGGGNTTENSGSTSATGVFGTMSTPPRPAADEDLLASLRQMNPATVPPGSGPMAEANVPEEEAAPGTAKRDGAAKPAGPGEFTRMLQSLKAVPSGAAPQPASSQDLASIFKQVSVERRPGIEEAIFSAKTSAQGPPGGEAGDAPSAPAGQAAAASGPSVTPANGDGDAAPGSTPGSFTSLFQAVSSHSGITPPAASARTGEGLPKPAGAGEFTQFFQAVQNAPPGPARAPEKFSPPPAGQKSEPGSFTQMFSRSPEARLSVASPAVPSDPAKNDFWQDSNASAAQANPVPGGGFTQLFQALNDEGAAGFPAADAPMAPAANPVGTPPPAGAAGGGFTQLFRSLGTEPPQAAPAPIAYSPQQSAPATPAGPGEYTRVISNSALRDRQGATPLSPSGPPAQASAPAPAVFARPAVPAAPPLAMPSAPHLAPPAFSFPPASAPPPPAPAPAPSGLQKYLPLILLVNVFLLVAIVLILVFVLRHH